MRPVMCGVSSSSRLFAAFLLGTSSLPAANVPPVVAITAPAAGTTLYGPTTVHLAASASSADSTIASVAFYNGAKKLATVKTTTNSLYEYSWANVAVGSYTVTAVATDALGLASPAAAVSFTMSQDQKPVVALSVPAAGTTLIGPATIALVATATSPDVTIASVAFLNGTTKLGTVTVPVGSTYTYTWKNAQANTYTVTAVATDSSGMTGTSAPVTVTVDPDQPPLVTSFTAVPASGYGTIGPTQIVLTATAVQQSEPIASVTFLNGTTKVATATKAVGGLYSATWKGVQANTYSLTAQATDTLGKSGTAGPLSLTITPDLPPIVSMTAPASGATITGPTSIPLSAAAYSTDEPLAGVAYYYVASPKDVKIGSATKPPFAVTWKNAAAGPYTLYAVATDFLGVTTQSSPVEVTIVPDQPPTVSIVTPANGSTVAAPGSMELTASAATSAPGVTIASVAYTQGTTKLATVKTAPYAYNWKGIVAGTYTLTATATDSIGLTANSAPVVVTVTSATTSSVKLTAPASGKVLAAPASVTLAATASAPAGVASVGFYANATLLGTATASPYTYAWQNIPAGTYYLTAVETDTQGHSVTSSPVTFTSDAPPVVTLGTPAAGSVFAAPATINLSANVADSGRISKVEFFQGAKLLGTATVAPYQYSWAPVAVGNYSLTAEAFDSLGITAISPAVPIQVVNDTPPVITLLTPLSALVFSDQEDISLSYSVTDASTSVASVGIYRDGIFITTLTGPASGTTWTFTEPNSLFLGTYTYFARAYDATGASTDSTVATVTVAQPLPYLIDFEAGDGFAVGPLAGQLGWNSPQGTANVSGTVAYSGTQSVQLVGGTPVAVAQLPIAPAPGETIVFCDFYAEPVAETSIAASTLFTAEQAQFAFLQSGGQGILEVFQGDGNGGGTWAPTAFTIPLNASNQATSWVRLTARLDFTRGLWDMYANGNMVAYDIPFVSAASTSFSMFQVQGDAVSDSFFDTLSIQFGNPLFYDSANDGISDAWKAEYGLPVTQDDRYLNVSGDGIPIIQDFVDGASPLINTKVVPDPVQAGLILDLRADAGVVTNGSGAVTQWLDQGPVGNIAYQSYAPDQPTLEAAQVNGLPAIVFNGHNTLALPAGILQSATSGEVIGVVEVSSANTFGMLWNFGTGFGSTYAGNQHLDDFGTSDTSNIQDETLQQITQYYIYDTSIDAAGTSIYRNNGFPEWTRTGLPVGFQFYPDIGGYGDGSFIGSIAEVIVYDRVLSDQERTTISQYLLSKYAFPAIPAPPAPTDLLAEAQSSDQVDLSWTVPGLPMHTVATIQRQVAAGPWVQVAQVSDASSYTDTGLSPGTAYTYQVTIQGYAGTSGPSNTSTVTTPDAVADLPQQGLSLWLRSTAGTSGAGNLITWADQSGLGNDAIVQNATYAPQVVEGQANGLPVVRFDGQGELILPAYMLQAAQSGQIIAVVKVGSNPGNINMLWNFGTYLGSSYLDGTHFEDFGTSDPTTVQVETQDQISQYYVYDTSIDPTGLSTYRYDGTPLWTRTGLQVGFGAFPDIGGFSGDYVGDIVEILLYDRVLSPAEQATVYQYYAAKYALPAAAANVGSPAITSGASALATTGQPFSFPVTATGSPTAYGAVGLPAGLGIDPVGGGISGVPDQDGTFPITVTATNGSGTGSSPFTLTVGIGVPVFTSAPSASGEVNQPFSFQASAIDATGYSASGLPDGLSQDPNAGLISGTPTTAGTYTVALSATDSAGTGTATLTIVVNASIDLTSPATASGQVGQAFSYQVTTDNTVTSYGATGLPPGLSIDPVAGLISGTPTATGTYTVTLSLANGVVNDTATVTIVVNASIDLTSPATASGQVGQAFSYQVTADNTVTSYGATGLPPGLSIDPVAGLISGTPTASGTYTVTLSLTNGVVSTTATLTITVSSAVPVITSATSASGFVGQPFSYQIVASNGPTSYVASGLPPGLGVDPVAGLISGTPTAAGAYSVDLTATNAQGSGTAALTLTFTPQILLTSPATASGTVQSSFSYQISANITPTSYSATGLPPGLSVDPSSGLISGIPTAAGAYTVTLSLTDASGTGTVTLTITVAPDVAVASGLVLWLKADEGVVADGSGDVSQWTDQSGAGNDAIQTNAPNQPLLVANQDNGLPVIHFAGSDLLSLPYDMMQAAQAGQVIAVVRVGNKPDAFSMLWNFGTGFGTSYYNTLHFDDFGSSDTSAVVVETQAQISQFFVYDTSIDSGGDSTYRYDGTALWSRTGLSVGYQIYPDIGGYYGNGFVGDIAEIFVYNRVLSPQEQGEVYAYLASKYAMPAVAASVGSPAITSAVSVTAGGGQAFSYQIAASNSPTSFGASGLPDALGVDPASGLISGVPTTPGTYTVSISATNASGTGSTPMTLNVSSGPPVITSAAAANGVVGQFFGFQVQADDFPTSFVAIGLPPGFGIYPNGGYISGTPTLNGVYNVALTVSNAAGTATQTLVITIAPTAAPPVVQGPATAEGQVGTAFAYQIVASNDPTAYASMALPPGLTLNTATGLISGTPTATDSSSVTLTATNAYGNGAETVAFTIAPSASAAAPSGNGMVLWVEADTGIQEKTVNGIQEAIWPDQSGNGFSPAQTLVNNGALEAPASVPNVLNGHAVMHFNAAQAQFLVVPHAALNGTTAGDIFVVFREPSAGVFPPSGDIPGAWEFGEGGTFFSDVVGAYDDFLSLDQNYAAAPVSYTTFNLYNATSSGTNWSNRLNGKLLFSTTQNVFENLGAVAPVYNGTTEVEVEGQVIGYATWVTDGDGDIIYGGEPFDGDIAEMIIYNRTLAPLERLAVGQYLEAKYNLPNISPETAPPTNFNATPISPSNIYLSWSPPSATFGVFYTISRQSGSGAYEEIGQVEDAQSFIDTGLSAGTAYNYQVTASSYAGGASPSAAASATTLGVLTGIPAPGLQLWLRADVGVAGPTAGSAAAWGDQSGNGNYASQASVANAPTLSAGALNGHPVVHFNSSAKQSLRLPEILSPTTNTGELLVVIRSSTSGYAYTFSPTGTDIETPTASNVIADGFLSSVQQSATIPAGASLANFNLYNVTASTGEWINFLNGSYLFSASGGEIPAQVIPPVDLNTPAQLGTDGILRTTNTNFVPSLKYLGGDIAEVIVYDRNLSDAERFSVGQYLQARYGLPSVATPAVPANVSAVVDPFGNVEVSWTNSSGATAYSVERSVDGGPWVAAAFLGADAPSGHFVDSGVDSGTVIQYKVQALSYTGQSAYSSPVSTPAPYAIDPATGLPYWAEADEGDSPIPNPPTTPPTPPSGPPGTSPPVITLTTPPNATLQ